jgi:formate dehydrogenase major subunit
MTKITRRQFFQRSAFTLGAVVTTFALSPKSAIANKKDFKTFKTKESTTICPFCGVGCGLIVSTRSNKVINIDGDPDHPINEGALCSKGAALYQVANNELRLSKVLYRAPGANDWEEKDWDFAVQKIALKIKETRDASFKKTDIEGRTINRTEAIACLGGAALDNEECYSYSKFARSLGVVYLEHQARI